MWKLIIQSPSTKRTEHQLEPGTTVIGRLEDNDIVLADQSVSREHARFVWDQESGKLYLHDMHSTNYTYANSRRVEKEIELGANDQVRIGNFLITILSEKNSVVALEDHSLDSSDGTHPLDQILIQAVDQYSVLLHDLSTKLVVISDLNEAIDLINNFVVRLLGALKSAIYLPEQIPSFLQTLNVQETVVQVVEKKIPVVFESKQKDPEKGEITVSNIVVPVLVDHAIFAMIHVMGEGANRYKTSDLQLVVAISHYAALTLQRLDFEKKLVHNAMHDPVTSLPNRISLMKQLEYTIAKVKRNPEEAFALFFIDIDDFKLVNDNLGHVVGDKVLSVIASRLKLSSREFDLLVRFGGDEFAILYQGTADITELTLIAQRLIAKISQPIKVKQHEIKLNISVGVTVSSIGYGFPEEVIRDADAAMYQAKGEEGIHLKFFDKSMHMDLVNLLQMQNKLRAAHKRGDFVLQYQPIVGLEDGAIIGLETLLRWDRPGAGLVTPDKFLSSVDTTGLLSSIEGWVIQTSSNQLSWINSTLDLNSPLFLTINLSEKKIRQPNLFDLVSKALEINEIPPNLLWLEVTEQIKMRNLEAAASIFESFRSMGIKICLDDFGTGQTSLVYLNSLPIDILKIDKSFVQDITVKSDQERFVRAIIGLGKNLGLKMVAEGVETEEQLALLRQMGCDYAQGYLFSKPLDVVDIEDLLKNKPFW